ncbi:DUF2271 domain-containing protein [Oxalicibacterium faecigallinarum]|uniref:DUF2271 domain-containing protein n=1 Tax=Oxalicibacterium faecigallinarum TaxID=573741 RepID=A0A8J3AQS4_9BURK|nr:DUF2271 domain-containing protein [Oxalicibacterium faecigallinarum]GGI19308.1 hypothetical protein GCM10008066_18430 [Oxalicibacterium faecigallinarum]
MQVRYSFLLGAALTTPVVAADLNVKVEIPRLTVAEYHRPYVAFWIEDANQGFVKNLAVWYDIKMKNKEGEKWLKDMRQWWRKSGRELTMPVDGVSGATRAPGEHTLSFNGAKTGLDKLPAGEYQLVVEAAREVGGRELIRVPFQWPAKSAQTAEAQGEHELGKISLQLKP